MIRPHTETAHPTAYRVGVALAVLTAFVTVWTTIVRDDGNGIGFLAPILTALVAAFAAGFRPAGMARGMLGVAIMQVMLAGLIATAPSVAAVPGASAHILLFGGILAALWLSAAAAFRVAARAALDR